MLCVNTILCWVHRSANTDNLLYNTTFFECVSQCRLSKGPGQSILRCDAHPGGVALVDCLTDDAKMYQYILAGRGNLLMLSHLGCAAQGTD